MPRSVCDQPDLSQGGQALVVTAMLAKRRLKRGQARTKLDTLYEPIE